MQGYANVDVTKQTVSLDGPHGMKTLHYDLLVGADGIRSEVRKVLVSKDRSMKSEYGFVGPLRYVTATKLEVPSSWPSPPWQQIMQPARKPPVQDDPYGLRHFEGGTLLPSRCCRRSLQLGRLHHLGTDLFCLIGLPSCIQAHR